MSDVWQLRRATAADLEPIMALETSIFTTDAWSPATMKAELAAEHGHYVVAYRVEAPGADAAVVDARDAVAQARIDGYAGLLAPRGAAEADIQTIAVAESARRHGVGRALVAALLGEAAARGAHEVFLEVRADNPGAQALYRSFDFEQIAVRPHYYQPDDVAAVVMRAYVRDGGPSTSSGTENSGTGASGGGPSTSAGTGTGSGVGGSGAGSLERQP
jgi:ribosomal protein S18 acetylase RimI-like enzyme